jgi:hypothetical protein
MNQKKINGAYAKVGSPGSAGLGKKGKGGRQISHWHFGLFISNLNWKN